MVAIHKSFIQYIFFNSMLELYRELDFSREIEQDKDLKVFIIQACRKLQQEQQETVRKLKKPQLDDELANHLIISGVPKLTPDKQEKFLTLFKTKLLEAKKIGEKNGLTDIQVGMEGNVGNQTLYLTYRSKEEAKSAFRKLNNFKFDKQHTLQCFNINEVRDFIEEEAKEREKKEEKEPVFATAEDKIRYNLDANMRDQFLVRQANMIYLNWMDHLDKSATSALDKDFMNPGLSINRAVFSSLGGYLALCCPEGVHLYYGDALKYKGFLEHPSAADAKFSPDERYIVTSNNHLSKSRQNFILWSLQEQIKLKAYKAHTGQSLDSFQFSSDQQLAIIQQHEVVLLGVGDLEELKRQIKAADEDQHIVKALHVQRIAWVKEGWLCVMCYELDYNPVGVAATRIFLYSSRTREQRKWRAWSEHAKQGEIFVSERGEWVAISLKKFLKKNHFATSIQIGNLLKRDEQPLEVSSIEVKEQVGNVCFDSRNNRVAVIVEDESTKRGVNVRFIVSFYELSIRQKTIEINKIGQIKDNLQNRVALASSGSFFTLYNITEQSPEKGKFSLGIISREHKEKGKRSYNFQFTKQNLVINGMNFFHLQPSGRFILCGTEKGYQIWNYIGEIVTKDTLQKTVYDVQWRPRVLNLLPPEEEKKIAENQREIRKKYEQADKERIIGLLGVKQRIKWQQKQEFLAFMSQKNKWYSGFAEHRSKVLGFKEFQARTQKYEVEQGFIDLQ